MQSDSFTFGCQKTQQKKKINPRAPLIYLKLRSKSCDKEQALRFASKIKCRSDSTKIKQGPVYSQILKIEKNKQKTIPLVRGWRPGNLKLDLGKKFQCRKPKVTVHEEIKLLNRAMHNMNNKKLKKYLESLEVIKTFFKSQAQRKLKGLGNKDRLKEIRKIRKMVNFQGESNSVFSYPNSESLELNELALKKRKVSAKSQQPKPTAQNLNVNPEKNFQRKSEFFKKLGNDEKEKKNLDSPTKKRIKIYEVIKKKVEKAKNKKRFLNWQSRLYTNVAKHSQYLTDVNLMLILGVERDDS